MAHDEDGSTSELLQLASKKFPAPIRFPLTSYSHYHDLLAIATSSWDVAVFRITNGQVAFTIRQRAIDTEVTALQWKADGTCLGVGWSDGHYAIHDGGTGKQLQLVSLQSGDGEEEEWLLDLRVKDAPRAPAQPPPPPAGEDIKLEPKLGLESDPGVPAIEPPKVGCFGWMGHEIVGDARKASSGSLTADDWYDELDTNDEVTSTSKKTNDAVLTDLPRAITALDVTRVLPKLSAIQSHSTKETKILESVNKFSSQQATNTLFHTRGDTASNVVQSVLVCQDDGSVQVLLDETVKVGSSTIPGKPVLHAAHPQSASHAILSEAEDLSLTVNFLDLPLTTLGGPLLHVIATNTKRIQILLEYVVQTVRCIENDFTTSIAFPQKMMGSLEGFLENEIESDPVLNLFHLAMSGSFNEPLLEWFTVIIKDRHQKTWEQTMTSMYTHLQNHVFINLLPALDRFSTALTSLRGLATFYEGSSKFDCPAELFTSVLEHIDSLRLVAQKMQLIIQTEHRQFRAFCKWTKLQVEIGVAGPISNSALEMEDREVPNLDYSLVLPYIKDTLTRSKLTPHVVTRPDLVDATREEEFFENPLIRDMSYERTKEALERLHAVKSDSELTMKDTHDPIALLNLPAITAGLAGHVRIVLRRITEWQSRMLARPTSIPLPLEPATAVLDMKMMAPSQQQSSAFSTTSLLALHPDTPNHMQIIQVLHTTESNSKRPASTLPPQPCTLSIHALPSTAQILDAKWIPHTTSSFLTLSKAENGQTTITKHTITSTDPNSLEAAETQQVFAEKGNFKPLKLVVGGRKGKVICVVLGNKGREWRVYDLSAGVQTVKDDNDDSWQEDDEMVDSEEWI